MVESHPWICRCIARLSGESCRMPERRQQWRQRLVHLGCLIGILCSPSSGLAETLYAPGFEITIDSECEEGEVVCERLIYQGKDFASGQPIRLQGVGVYAFCADGQTPCHYLGARFLNQGWVYFLSAENVIEVTRPNGILFQRVRLARCKSRTAHCRST